MARTHEAMRDSGNGRVYADSDGMLRSQADSAYTTQPGQLTEAFAALARRSIAPLIVILFVSVAIATATYVYRIHADVTGDAQAELAITADLTRAGIIHDNLSRGLSTALPPNHSQLVEAMPETVNSMPVYVIAANAEGEVVASEPFLPETNGRTLDSVLKGAPGAYTQGRFAGYLDLTDESGREYLAVARRLPDGQGFLITAISQEHIRGEWMRQARFSASILLSMDLLVLLIGMAFHWQASWLRAMNEQKSSERIRLATALSRGRCGLWEWNIERGELTFSDSMCALLGLPARETRLCVDDALALIHPDDINLRDLSEELQSGKRNWIDQAFRMRHEDGSWVWLRARADVITEEDDPERLHLFGIAIDISEKKRIEAMSRQADTRLRDAIENISESFVLWDRDQTLLMCNSKFIEQNGIDPDITLAGRARSEIAALGKHMALIEHDGGEPDGKPVVCQLEDGRWLTISERRTSDGGTVSVGTDITQLKRHEERLVDSERTLIATVADLQRSRQALQVQTQQLVELADRFAAEKVRAELASKSKSDFLANMSHELRTPLNAIMGFSEILTQQTFGPLGAAQYRGYAKDIHASGKYLFDLITDILDMSKIEAGRYVLDVSKFDLSELARECVRIMSLKADEKKIETNMSIAAGMELNGDRRAVKQILLNLLSNAVKFTDMNGQINLRARRVRDTIIVSIEDNGVGIPSGALSRLGRPFEQAANQMTKNHQGSGLGLAISRSLTEMHGGSLRIRSYEGKGTIVTMRLPVNTSDRHKGNVGRSAA